jgi:hypothetical protein
MNLKSINPQYHFEKIHYFCCWQRSYDIIKLTKTASTARMSHKTLSDEEKKQEQPGQKGQKSYQQFFH